MATADSNFYRPQIQPHQGSTITDLEQVVEHVFLTGPLLTVAQIRALLRVEQACELCEASGSVETRGYNSEHVYQEKCPDCKGRGYVIPEKEEVTQ